MAAYHLWMPAYVRATPLTIEAFVTLGDSIFLGSGTQAFADAAVAAIGIDSAAQSWRLEPVRTHYFGSYRDIAAHREDVWDLAWRLRVEIAAEQPPLLPTQPDCGYVNLDTVDRSFRPEHAPRALPGWPCLLIADAEQVSVLDRCRALAEAAQPQADSVVARVSGRPPQLRCDLGAFPRSFYEQGAEAAERLLRRFEAAGATLRPGA